MSSFTPLRPVVLIGAARSGTKITRDALAMAVGVPAVPYDVGYVWRYGNDRHPDDRLLAEDVRPRTRRLVHSFLGRYTRSDGLVIEKSVGNALRVGYVAEIVPDAIFVHLVRNGIDVAESTYRQWKSPVEYGYLREKLRHFPVRMVPTYGLGYATSLVRRRVAADGRVASWGPRYAGIDQDLHTEDLLTICARQWRESVTLALEDLATVDAPVIEVRYEDLVSDPASQLRRLASFAGLPVQESALLAAAATVRGDRAGAGGRSLTPADLGTLDHEIGGLMKVVGYPPPAGLDLQEDVSDE